MDDLHERAGSANLLHLHGELDRMRCEACGAVHPWTGEAWPGTPCPACGRKGALRPHIVWFGEMPFHLDRIQEALDACGLFIAIGTSGQVYPAAGFVEAVRGDCRTLELNLEASAVSSRFRERRQGPATVQVPLLVEELLAPSPGLAGPGKGERGKGDP